MERSAHDALCAVRRVLESGKLTPGGGAVEAALSIYLENFATTLVSVKQTNLTNIQKALKMHLTQNLLLLLELVATLIESGYPSNQPLCRGRELKSNVQVKIVGTFGNSCLMRKSYLHAAALNI